MPYRINQDMSASVRGDLPAHAQDIFREAFNNAFAAHAGEADREERAFRTAWAVVKHRYEKSDGQWIPR